MDSYNILPLLGLALRGGNLAVGEEPVEAVARARDARILLLASDAADNTRRRVEHFAQAGQCLWARLPFSKAELGRALGRSSVAVAAVTDTGLAAALGRKLASLDPEQYGPLSQRLEVKAQRARQRRTEQEAHEKNLRAGKRRPKRAAQKTRQAPPAAEKPPEAPASPARRRTGEGPARPRRQGRSPSGRPGSGQNAPRDRGGRNRPNPYVRSRPVKKGKGSFRKREDGSVK